MELISPTELAKEKVLAVQEYSILSGRAVGALFRRPRYIADIVYQADLIGFGSLPIVVLTGFFIGGALALNSASTLERFGSLSLIGQLVSVGMVRELGPVLTGLMVAGRNASGIASELGSMVVTEQIDAMRALGVDPVRKLVTPRIYSSIAMLLLLTIVSDAFGILGGAAVTVFLNHQNGTQYFHMAYERLHYPDIIQGLVKPLFFGYILGSTGCFYGMRTTGGTEGVGRATISAVVNSSVIIIAADFVITHILLFLFPT